jgi:hypothetical protein
VSVTKTGNKPAPPRCALGGVQPTQMDAEEVKRRGWQEDGILVVAVSDPRLGMIEREFVRQIGNKLNGKARNANE